MRVGEEKGDDIVDGFWVAIDADTGEEEGWGDGNFDWNRRNKTPRWKQRKQGWSGHINLILHLNHAKTFKQENRTVAGDMV